MEIIDFAHARGLIWVEKYKKETTTEAYQQYISKCRQKNPYAAVAYRGYRGDTVTIKAPMGALKGTRLIELCFV